MPFQKSRLLRCCNRAAVCVLALTLMAIDALRSAYAQVASDVAPAVAAPATAELPRDLSPWGMFLSADALVKGVLICLVLASIATWTVWLAKTFELITAKRGARRAFDALAQARSISDGAGQLGRSTTVAGKMVQSAIDELRLSDDTMEREGIRERVASRLERIEAQGGRLMMRSTGILATIGAIAPFVGLFGTVWGIMNSFIGISKSQTTNLAVVAPGIAEALLATAFGLAAAIPAVVIYNMFSRQIAGYRALLGDTSAEVLRIVGRDLDRATTLRARTHLSAAE